MGSEWSEMKEKCWRISRHSIEDKGPKYRDFRNIPLRTYNGIFSLPLWHLDNLDPTTLPSHREWTYNMHVCHHHFRPNYSLTLHVHAGLSHTRKAKKKKEEKNRENIAIGKWLWVYWHVGDVWTFAVTVIIESLLQIDSHHVCLHLMFTLCPTLSYNSQYMHRIHSFSFLL